MDQLDNNNWRSKVGDIIFDTDTRAGRLFDLLLLIAIILSVLVVFLDSVFDIHDSYGRVLFISEWIFTIIFSIEYILRIYIARKRAKYVLSFYGIIDLLSVIPTYLTLFVTGGQYLIVIRILRLLRIFRILKLSRYIGASGQLVHSLKNSRHKIAVFLWTIMMLVIIMGAIMYIVEGPENGFSSIPESIYWAIVTLTTVGYGDISPHTPLGKAIASVIMIIGYAIIAVPTGIISVEMSKVSSQMDVSRRCSHCNECEHDIDAVYCKYCGKKITKP